MVENLDYLEEELDDVEKVEKVDDVEKVEKVDDVKKVEKDKKPKLKQKKEQMVIAESVHVILYSAPDTFSRKVTRLNVGNRMVIKEELDDWLKVSFHKSGEELNGFVRTNKVRRV